MPENVGVISLDSKSVVSGSELEVGCGAFENEALSADGEVGRGITVEVVVDVSRETSSVRPSKS